MSLMSLLMKLKSQLKQLLILRKMKSRGIRISHHVSFVNLSFDDYVNIAHHAEIANSKIGKRTSVGRYTKIINAEIGGYCSISWDVTIGATGHPLNSVSTHAFTYRKQFGLCDKDYYLNHYKVIIGNDVWIGCHVVIMPGVKIADGAVLGAGAIVTKDVQPYEIVVGCPAKHLGYRFPKDTIKRFLDIKWWNWDDKHIKDNISLFSYNVNINEMPDYLTKIENISLIINKFNK